MTPAILHQTLVVLTTRTLQYKHARINTTLSELFAWLEPLTIYMQSRSARGSDDGSGSQTRKPRYLTPDQLRAAGDIARATFHANSFPCPWTFNIKVRV
jgi:hypothetical protein